MTMTKWLSRIGVWGAGVGFWSILLGVSCALAADDDDVDSFDILGEFPSTNYATRVKPNQFRFSFFQGTLDLRSERPQDGTTFGLAGKQWGSRLEYERWFTIGRMNQKRWGLLSDSQLIYVGTLSAPRGNAIFYSSTSLSVGYRLLGSGAPLPFTPELCLFLGPSMEFFPSMAVSLDLTQYDVKVLSSLGAKVGSRFRFSLLWQRLAAEAQAYAILPVYSTSQADGGALLASETRSYGLNLIADFQVPKLGVIVGGGFFFAMMKLGYDDPYFAAPGRTLLIARSVVGTLRWSF